MTIEDVQSALAEIAGLAEQCEYERAHAREDALFAAVLRRIAEADAGPSGGLAREALKSLDIDFQRWCA